MCSSLKLLTNFLIAQPYTAEVLVIENGSQDATLQIAQDFVQKWRDSHGSDYPSIEVLSETKRGKGRAVKRGMLEAKGELRYMCDVDFSMPVEEINRFTSPMINKQADIVIASREAPGAVRYYEPAYRHFVGRIFNLMIRLTVLPGLQDTQCGFKCFRDTVAEDVFRYQTISGWSFDIEVLYVARLRGYRILEIPIPWYFNANSHISVLRDSFRMVLDLLIIRINSLRGLYAD